MTIKLKGGAEFLHIPKTGGSWVEEFLKENDLILEYFGHPHADYDRNLINKITTGRECLEEAARLAKNKLLGKKRTPVNEANSPVFRFCFVRHPLSWYESWWKYMQGREWNDWGTQNSKDDWHPNSVLNGLGSSDFNEFVSNVVNVRPGYVTELLYAYTKSGISYIGKTESLREDLGVVLDFLGLRYDRDSLSKSPKINTSKVEHSEIQWDPDLKKMVKKLELPSLIHFDYLSDEEKIEMGVDIGVLPNKALHCSLNK